MCEYKLYQSMHIYIDFKTFIESTHLIQSIDNLYYTDDRVEAYIEPELIALSAALTAAFNLSIIENNVLTSNYSLILDGHTCNYIDKLDGFTSNFIDKLDIYGSNYSLILDGHTCNYIDKLDGFTSNYIDTLTTDNIDEGTDNLYYTNARVGDALIGNNLIITNYQDFTTINNGKSIDIIPV